MYLGQLEAEKKELEEKVTELKDQILKMELNTIMQAVMREIKRCDSSTNTEPQA
jgi:hypothetical protein